MFNNSKNQNNNIPMEAAKNQLAINMISQGTEIKGTLRTKNDIRISGKIDGEVQAEGKVILTSGGIVTGNITAAEVDIAGRVEGEIYAIKRLILRQSAIVKGDITTKVLLVEEGAVFEGDCKMDKTLDEKKIEFKTNNVDKKTLTT